MSDDTRPVGERADQPLDPYTVRHLATALDLLARMCRESESESYTAGVQHAADVLANLLAGDPA